MIDDDVLVSNHNLYGKLTSCAYKLEGLLEFQKLYTLRNCKPACVDEVVFIVRSTYKGHIEVSYLLSYKALAMV